MRMGGKNEQRRSLGHTPNAQADARGAIRRDGARLFGSFARDEATDESDVDILVRYHGPATSRSYFGVQFYIEDLLGGRVDLVTHKALRSEFRPYVEREAVNV